MKKWLPILAALPLFLLAEEDFVLKDEVEFNEEEVVVDEKPFNEGVTVDLRNPVICEGTLSTEEGGVVTAPNIRIQAQIITYTKTDEFSHSIEASENVVVEYGEYIFVGNHIQYDFNTKIGIIYEGRSGLPPWYFGGRILMLLPDGSYEIYDGYITTSQKQNPEWKILTKHATLKCGKFLNAQDVYFRYNNYSLFWLPRFRINLDTIFDNPVSYNMRWWGGEGPRFGVKYEVLNWNHLRTFLRFDYRVTRGPGGGIETYYTSPTHRESLETINYLAHDNSIEQPNLKYRFRFQGLYHREMNDDKTSLDLSWDKLSDRDFATDYNDKDLELDIAGRTQANLRHQESWWISNLLTRVQVNSFQTIKQELPSFQTSIRPFTIANTGVISENVFKASYLDFVYANNQPNTSNFNSPRVEMQNSLYRPFHLGFLNFTPSAGVLAIFYGNTPEHQSSWATAGLFGIEVNTNVHRFYGRFKHVATPYASYEYETFPTTPPEKHYIFDISDGQYRLNMVRFGMRNNFYIKSNNCVHRMVFVDVFSNAFFDTPTITGTIPKIYGVMTWLPTSKLKQTLDIAWDFPHNELDHINIRNEWTLSDDKALALEYRHRDRLDWRKVQKQNFILDSFRSINELKHSQLSDRRDTILLHFYWKYAPTWALEFESRTGWNRIVQPSYNEYVINLIGTLSSAWNICLSYRHKEDDDRVAVYLSVGVNRPNTCRPCFTPCLEF